eukprot:scaffold40716_cov60-Phaeocystis_antarctica.AAC.2
MLRCPTPLSCTPPSHRNPTKPRLCLCISRPGGTPSSTGCTIGFGSGRRGRRSTRKSCSRSIRRRKKCRRRRRRRRLHFQQQRSPAAASTARAAGVVSRDTRGASDLLPSERARVWQCRCADAGREGGEQTLETTQAESSYELILQPALLDTKVTYQCGWHRGVRRWWLEAAPRLKVMKEHQTELRTRRVDPTVIHSCDFKNVLWGTTSYFVYTLYNTDGVGGGGYAQAEASLRSASNATA